MEFSWLRRAKDSIGQACLTNSKRAESHIKGIYPTHFKKGIGARLYDFEDNGYLDYICGLGTDLLGYGNPLLTDDLLKYMDGGFSHSFPTHHEVEAAESLKSVIQFVERFKFLKTGNEATNAALIMARAHTGRTLVYSDGYHGHGAEFTSLNPPAHGCPPTEFIKPLPSVIPDLSDAAAVIIEPVICDFSTERGEYLEELRKKCTLQGCLLIFDEVITGFRFPKMCVSQYFRVKPDLIILGKAMAGGLPLAAVGGPKDVLDGKYFVSSTYAGEILSLRACIRTIEIMSKYPQYKIDELWADGEIFLNKFNAIMPDKIKIEGYPTRGRFIGDEDTRHHFFQEMCKAYHLFGPSWFYKFPMMPYRDHTLSICTDVLAKIKSGKVKLEGEKPQSPFAEVVRNGREGQGFFSRLRGGASQED